MEIMDNQVQEELDYILPDDYEEEAEDTTEAEQEESEVLEGDEAQEVVEEVDATTIVDNTPALDELEVKFLHEVKKLKDIPREELQTLVQKGMNHDRIAERYTQATEKLERMKDLGALYGMTETEVMDALFNRYYEDTADREGLTPQQVKARVEANKKDSMQRMFDKFNEKYPNVNANDIPKNVWEEVKAGEDLVRAYSEHIKQETLSAKDGEVNQLKTKIAELEGKLKTFTQNETVKKKAVVKSTSVNGSDNVKEDDFLAGLLGD